MTDWKKTSYGAPKTWAEIQHEKSEAELEKVSASPVPMMFLVGLGLLLTVLGIIAFIVLLAR